MQKILELLLVEDNDGDVEMTLRAFQEDSTCNISVANDGIEALDFLHKRGKFLEAPNPQLILLDLNMPRMNGKEFLDVVKQDSQFKVIPIIMLTSSDSAKDIRECYERHVNCYVIKPFDGKEFREAVKQVVHFWRGLGQLL